jgi:hypothetical protein
MPHCLSKEDRAKLDKTLYPGDTLNLTLLPSGQIITLTAKRRATVAELLLDEGVELTRTDV